MKVNSRYQFPVSLVLATLVAVATFSSGNAGAEDFAIRAKTIYTGEGEPIQNGFLVVRDGKVASVGADAPGSMKVIDRSKDVLVPGFVDLNTTHGSPRGLAETASA